MLSPDILDKLKDTNEQRTVVGPLIAYLVASGWSLDQMVFGRAEWRVPKTPSEATKRERGRSFEGFPVDIAVFDDPAHVQDYRHLLFIIECKEPNEKAGISQLEIYFGCEPHVKLGVWSNNADPSAAAAYIYRQPDGRILLKRQHVSDLPTPGEAIRPESKRLAFNDLIALNAAEPQTES